MLIKDKTYWKEYNQKRKQKGYFQQNYLQRKEIVKNGEGVVKSLQPNKEIVNNSENILQHSPVIKVVKNGSLQSATILQSTKEILQPPKCPRCPEIETSISNFANLYQQEKDKTQEQKRINRQLEKKAKELELKIISLQATNQILRKDLEIWQNPINPTIELWKKRYFNLEKKSDERWKELDQTINRLKEKLREKDKENQAWEQKYSNLENQAKIQTNSLSLSTLNHLITKHTKIQNSQHLYNEKDRKERQFLKSLLDKLWIFN